MFKAVTKTLFSSQKPQSELAAAFYACRFAFAALALFSAISNLLMLTGPLFMLQVYDRVLTSRSMPTLAALIILVVTMFIFVAVFDLIRSRILLRVGRRIDEDLNKRIFHIVCDLPLATGRESDDLMPVRDLDQLRQFITSSAPICILDMPWVPVYLLVVFAFHYTLGLAALVGIIILAILSYMNEKALEEPTKAVSKTRTARNVLAGAAQRNSEVVAAMGMSANLSKVWSLHHSNHLHYAEKAGDTAASFTSSTKAFRMLMQSLLLAIGAILVIEQMATPGVMIASSIIATRALAPIEQAIGQWRNFAMVRHSYDRLNSILSRLTPRPIDTTLPRPEREVSVEDLAIVPPGSKVPSLTNVSFKLKAGDGLGIIGPSAAGKSSLARAIVGVWKPARGSIRFDGATPDQWTDEVRGKYIGYLPQDVELFAGTIAENIARFDAHRTDAAVLEAAELADVHDMIVRFSEGYDTMLGEGGAELSAGQRQRIGLARALYRRPFLVVLDEPNSNLDHDGDMALTKAIRFIRSKGSIVVIVAHRPSAVEAVDTILVLGDGRVRALGPKMEVMNRTLAAPAVAGLAS